MKLLYLKAKFQFLHFGNQFNLKMIYKGVQHQLHIPNCYQNNCNNNNSNNNNNNNNNNNKQK